MTSHNFKVEMYELLVNSRNIPHIKYAKLYNLINGILTKSFGILHS